MKKTLWRMLLLVALVLYSLVVYSWWVEGNSNRYKWQMEQENNYEKIQAAGYQ